MNTVRLNITLPEELAGRLDELAPARKKSCFIAEALAEKIKEIQNDQLQKLLEEGYKATKGESFAIAKEFEPADLEGWDEY